MSDTVIFDTNLHIKRIAKTGVSHETAEAFVETVAHVLEHNLATKTDIEALRLATKTDIELLRKETQIAITKLENKLIRWIVGMTLGMTLTTILAFIGIAAVFIK